MQGINDLLAKFDEIDVSEYVEFFESRKIGENVVVHSRFKGDDLRLLRRASIGYIRSGVGGSDESRCRGLFRRMLRREGR